MSFEREVLRTYLQLRTPGEFQPARLDDPRARLEQVVACPPAVYLRLYREVGEAYHWVDRLGWDDGRAAEHLASPAVTIWLLRWDGAEAGWFELKRHDDASVEIAYFGLLPGFLGRGLGKHMLTEAVDRAWALGAARVWLHTCTLDDPAALPNYLKRGFKPFRTETYKLVQ